MDGDQGEDDGKEWTISKDQLTSETQNRRKEQLNDQMRG